MANEQESVTRQLPDPETGEMVDVKTYYYHCDHGYVIWQQRSTNPAAIIKCPMSGCIRTLVPGRAPKRPGVPVKGHD